MEKTPETPAPVERPNQKALFPELDGQLNKAWSLIDRYHRQILDIPGVAGLCYPHKHNPMVITIKEAASNDVAIVLDNVRAFMNELRIEEHEYKTMIVPRNPRMGRFDYPTKDGQGRLEFKD